MVSYTTSLKARVRPDSSFRTNGERNNKCDADCTRTLQVNKLKTEFSKNPVDTLGESALNQPSAQKRDKTAQLA
jgi:hypothetical protein